MKIVERVRGRFTALKPTVAALVAVACFAYLQLALGVLLIGSAAKLAYGEATGERVATSATLGSIVAALTVAIGASLWKERRAPHTRPIQEVN